MNHKHPLFIPANKIDWEMFEREFSPLYCSDNERPAKPIRLMVGLSILKHVRNLSEESVAEQWRENIYYQYFCGRQEFLPVEPCVALELVHFRHRIGEEGIELILKESIRINGKEGEDKDKIYSLHEPEVRCIGKGKENKPYGFGNKASFAWTVSGEIVSVLGFRNEYDGHTFDKSVEQVERLRESPPGNGIGDRGYQSEKRSYTFQTFIKEA